jgi:DNA polymerase
MSAPDIFDAGLDVVIEALQTRVHAGGTLKASASELSALLSIPNKHSAGAPVTQSAPKTPDAQSVTESTANEPNARSVAKTSRNPEFAFPLLPTLPEEGSREVRLLALKESVVSCLKCEHLAASRRNVVYGEGAADAKLLFVSEAPGPDEDMQGRPFAGEAGALLDKMLQAMGLSRQQVYLTSVLKCRPDVPGDETGSRPPTILEMSSCAPYLASQISIIKPQVIVAMGAGAMRALFGSNETVGKLRSHWHDLQGIPVMPTFHPSYLIRNQSNTEKRKVWEDLLQVMERLNFEITDKQRGYFKPRAGA